MRTISEIIIHATATKPNFMEGSPTAEKVAEVRRWHMQDNGWSDVGYHYLIDRDGTVAKGRPLERIGAHVRGHNTGTIGVALFGGHGSSADDKFLNNFTFEQWAALRELLDDLQKRFGPLKITGHNVYAAKACPGFRVDQWLKDAMPEQQAPDIAKPESKPSGLLEAIFAFIASLFGGKK